MLCLQGGGEFSAGCRDMDAQLLELAGGPVAILALAAAPGREYAKAGENGVAHFRSLGAAAFAVPDPREEHDADLTEAALIVLPGGSPSRLLEALRTTGLDAVLADHVAAGRALMGSSAGAMVLGEWTVLPEDGPRLATGLGLAPGVVVVPHWRGERDDWLALVGEGRVLGIPEESGVVLESGQMTAVGRRSTRLVREGADLRVGHTLAAS